MTLISAVTLAVAIVGAVLGILNTWKAYDRDRPKLRVIPKHAIPVGAADPRLTFCIEVVNLSALSAPGRSCRLAPGWSAFLPSQQSHRSSVQHCFLVDRLIRRHTGTTVCACFNVGRNAIQAAIFGGCRDAPAIGKRLKAGTNCGSCIPELHRMIAAGPVPAVTATATAAKVT
jgi:bacterioferritin-associated ferredoxin